MAISPYTDPLARRRQLQPPPPPVPDAQPSFAQSAQSSPLDAGDMTPPPITLPQPTTPQQVAGQQPASGLNSVGRALEKARSQPLEQAAPAVYDGQPASMGEPAQRPEDTPQLPAPTEDPGTPPAMRLSRMASLQDRLHATQNAPPNTDITTNEYGQPVVGATKPMTRRHMIVQGLLQGALEGAARTGKWQGALGGAATGAVAGGVKPSLIGGLEQHQEEERLQGDLNTEVANRTKQAQLGDIAAQTKERDQQPEIRRLQIAEQERIRQAGIDASDRRAVAANTSREKVAADRTAREDKRHQETMAHPQYRTDPTTGDIIEITPGKAGGQATSRVLRKGSKEAASAAVAQSLYDSAGKLYDDSHNGYEALTKQAEDLHAKAEDDPMNAAIYNKRADKIEKDADDLKKKVQGLQTEGDKRRAESAVTAPTSAGKPSLKGRTITQSNFDRYKKDHGDVAAQQLLDGGVTIRN